MKRRTFIGGACATLAATAMLDPANALANENNPELISFKRAQLIGLDGKPLKASSLRDGESFLFYYPYISSPAFLINTGVEIKPVGEWAGGTGNKKTIVAFAAICTHLLSHPKKSHSPISYRHKKQGQFAKKDRVITCCVHGSVFDMDQGGKRLSGPAKASLVAITLEHDNVSDTLTATGVYGEKWVHEKFLKRFKKDLRKSFGRSEYKNEVEKATQIMKLEDLTPLISKC